MRDEHMQDTSLSTSTTNDLVPHLSKPRGIKLYVVTIYNILLKHMSDLKTTSLLYYACVYISP